MYIFQSIFLCIRKRQRFAMKYGLIACIFIYINVIAKAAGQYTYAGCFTDKPERALPNHIATYPRKVSIQKCAKKSQELGYAVFAVQYFEQCWSGDGGQYAKYGYSKNCKDGIGGGWANAVYTFNVDYIYVGCFKDNKKRAMPSKIGDYRLTKLQVIKCANRARTLGYKAFGVQFGGECWSGAGAHQTYATYKYHNNCKNGIGGLFSNAVYLFNSDNVSSMKCDKPLGVEDGRIPDTAITSSSDFDYNHRASNGRLNFEPRNGRTGAWSAGRNNIHQWIQVDFAQEMAVKRVSTQGRPEHKQWVRRYTLSYSQDGVFQFVSFRNNQVFRGNTDQNTIVINDIDPWIKAKSVRLHPKSWFTHVSLRVEFYGCKIDPIPPPKCLFPLGMQKGLIPDKNITASSIWDNNHRASNGRLHFKAGNGRTGSWSSGNNDDKQFLQVDFGTVVNMTGIATQGRQDLDQWVTRYTLSYSDNKINFVPYGFNGNVERFGGNWNRNGVLGHKLRVPILAQYIRVHPIQWHIHISMRVEFYGCYRDSATSPPPVTTLKTTKTTTTTTATEPEKTRVTNSTTSPDGLVNKPDALKGDVRVDMFPFLWAVIGLLLLLLIAFLVIAYRLRRAPRTREPPIQYIDLPEVENKQKVFVAAPAVACQQLPGNRDIAHPNDYRHQQQMHRPLSPKESGVYESLDFTSPESPSHEIKDMEPVYEKAVDEESQEEYLDIIA